MCLLNCRFEVFNSLIRGTNVFSNRLVPSRDIARRFETLGHLRSICSGGTIENNGPR